jgi:type IV secretion system protein VirD4
MFDALEEKDPDHFAVRQYRKYKLAAGKTAKSILISCGARLAPFDIAELRELTRYDELELDTLGDEKTALFIICSDTDSTFDFVTAMICDQLFNVLCTKADDVYGGRLPIHVRFLLDEFANIKIPQMQRTISVLRSRECSVLLSVQTQSQLKGIYKEHADTIVGNTDCRLFLGGSGSELKTLAVGTWEGDNRHIFHTAKQGAIPILRKNYQKLGKKSDER